MYFFLLVFTLGSFSLDTLTHKHFFLLSFTHSQEVCRQNKYLSGREVPCVSTPESLLSSREMFHIFLSQKKVYASQTVCITKA